MLNKDLLNKVLKLTKEAYAPPNPAPGQMGQMPPGQDPALQAAAMPMDPAAMPPMDPAAMGAMPPMGPAAMPMDPAAMPPMDPAAMGAMPAGPGMAGLESQPVTLSAQDLQMLVEAAAAAQTQTSEPDPDKEDKGRVTNKELESRIDELEALIVQMAGAMGISVPEAPTYAEEAPVQPSVANLSSEASGVLPLAEEAGGMPMPMPSGLPAPPPLPNLGMEPLPAELPHQLEASEQDNALIQVLRALGTYSE